MLTVVLRTRMCAEHTGNERRCAGLVSHGHRAATGRLTPENRCVSFKSSAAPTGECCCPSRALLPFAAPAFVTRVLSACRRRDLMSETRRVAIDVRGTFTHVVALSA